jgi:hypothetical protein
MKTKTLTCANCHTSFKVPDFKYNQNRAYCGATCASSVNGKKNKGRKASKALREHFSRIRLGKGNPFYGKHHSKQTKEILSEIKKKSRNPPVSFTEKQTKILEGLLLSDGHIDANYVSGRYTQGCKYSEFLEHIKNALPLRWSPLWHDKKWNCHHMKSRFTPNLLETRKKWYPNGKKAVPKDLILSEETLLYWFLGDGSIRFQNRAKNPMSKTFEIKLATDSFSKSDNIFLISQLEGLGIKSSLLGRNQIRILAKSNAKFFKLIGNPPVQCYEYKWRGIKSQQKQKKS